MKKITISEAKQIDLVDYLASLGHYPDPQRSNNRDYWYLSPLPGRNEKTPSFKVDRKLNLWYDHGIGKGGSIIDFGIQYHSCTIPEFLERLQTSFSFHRNHSPAVQPPTSPVQLSGQPPGPPHAGEEKKIQVVSTGPITSPALLHYLGQRRIPVELAQAYCRELRYEIRGKQYYAIGFANDAGGYELRNPYFKGSCAPKGITYLDNGASQVAVFEGFFSFLSYLVIHAGQHLPATNFLILNSLSFFEKSLQFMEKHDAIHLYLDRDTAGIKCVTQVVKEHSPYKDCSIQYRDCKDLNQWLVQNSAWLQHGSQPISRKKRATDDTPNQQATRNKQGRYH